MADNGSNVEPILIAVALVVFVVLLGIGWIVSRLRQEIHRLRRKTRNLERKRGSRSPTPTRPVTRILRGKQGDPGANGLNGVAGTPGTQFFVDGGVPSASLGANGDLYLDTTTGDLYQKQGGTWVVVGQIAVPGAPLIDSVTFIVNDTDMTKRLGFEMGGGATGTTTTLATSQTTDHNATIPDIDGSFVMEQSGTSFVFMGGPITTLHGSNSGMQYSSLTANRAQLRCNQYGANTGVPGISTFKSRSATIGGLAPVAVGDVLFRDTVVGVTDNLSIPLSAFISIQVPTGGVPAGQGYIATEYDLQLVSLAGPANGRRSVFRITSEGCPCLRETTSGTLPTPAAGTVTLVAGSATVTNVQLTTTSRITLTVQPGAGNPPLGVVYVSAITAGVNFVISSTSAADVTTVYYQIWGAI